MIKANQQVTYIVTGKFTDEFINNKVESQDN